MTRGLRWEPIRRALSIALSAWLGFQALAFLAGGRAAFERLGYPDAARVILGGLELAAALLILHPRTLAVGAIGLLATLSWAAGFHFALRARTGPLLADLALVALLLAARPSPARAPGKETA